MKQQKQLKTGIIGLGKGINSEGITMIVTVQLEIYPHPKKDVETTLRWAAKKLAERKNSIQISFTEKETVVLKFWMQDKAHYKVVDEISEQIKLYCWEFEKESTIWFENDRKRKPRSRRRG